MEFLYIPAPLRVRSVVPSLLIALLLCGQSWAASGKKPFDVMLPPLVSRNAPPIWLETVDSISIIGGDSAQVHLVAFDPDNTPIRIQSFAMPDFVSLVDSGNGHGSLSITPELWSSGRFSMLLIAIDDSSAADTSQLTIIVWHENRPPVWGDSESDTVSILEGDFAIVPVSVQDPDGDSLSLQSEGEIPPQIITAGPGLYQLVFYAGHGLAGEYAIRVIASDGSLSDTITFTFKVAPLPPNNPPQWEFVDTDSIGMFEGGIRTLQVQAHDIDGDEIAILTECSFLTTTSDLGDGASEVYLVPAVGDTGRHILRVIASDGDGADTLEIVIYVAFSPNRNHSPTLGNVPAVVSLNIFRDTVFTVEASDPDGDPLTISILHQPAFVTLTHRSGSSPGSILTDINLSPEGSDRGLFPINIVASDGALSDTSSLWLNIISANYWPEIGDLEEYFISEGDTLETSLEAVDANGTITILTAINLPRNATFVDHHQNRGTFRFTPDYTQSGTYRIGFIANDGTLRDTAYLNVTVENTPRAPQFAALAPQSVNEGSTIRLRVAATDPDSDPLTLLSSGLPANASFVDSANGRGGITFSPVLGQIGPFEFSIIASDGFLSDTLNILIVVLQTTVPPDSAAEVDFVTEEVAGYSSSFAIDQLHVEDLNLDGIDEVLFRESTPGGHVLRIWSASGDSLWTVPSAGIGVKSYTLRAGNGNIDPVIWTIDNQLLGLVSDGAGWEPLSTVPDSVRSIQWLPNNPAGGLVLGSVPRSSSGYSEGYLGCTSYNSSSSSNSVLLTGMGQGPYWSGFGYSQVQPFDFGSALPVFWGGSQTDLLVFSYRENSGYEAWGDCGFPHSWKSKDFSLSTFIAGEAVPTAILTSIGYSCFSADGCQNGPNQYQFVVGLSRWNGSPDSVLRLCFAGRPGVGSGYLGEYSYRLTVLERGDTWTSTEVGLNLPDVPARGGIVTVEESGIEHMLLAPDAGFGYLASIPDATLQGRLAMPAAGRFKTGYVLDSAHRDVLFATASGVKIYRINEYMAPRDVGLVHRVPGNYPSIQAAINVALSGDTVLVAPGAYPGSIDFLGKDICVKSEAGPQLTEIRPASTTLPNVRIAAYESERAILEGFTIYGGTTTMLSIGNDAKPIIRNNIFHFSQGTANIVDVKSHGAQILRNVISNNAKAIGLAVSASGSARIYNNTFDRNGIGIRNDNPSTEFQNNLVTYSIGAGISGRFAISDYNDVWSNGSDYDLQYGRETTVGEHDLRVDPLYQDVNGGDFRLSENSICIDNGNPAPEYTDADGSIRDIGAIPYLAAAFPRAINLDVQAVDRWHLVSDSPEFVWVYKDVTQSTQAAYEIEVGADNVWQAPEIWSSGIVTSDVSTVMYSGSAFQNGRDYFVRVRVNNGSEWGTWTYEKFHTNGLPEVPRVEFPAHESGANPRGLMLSGMVGPDPEGDLVNCEFQVATDPNFEVSPLALSASVSASGTSYSDTLSMLPSGRTYWWRMRASDALEVTNWTAPRSFVAVDRKLIVPIHQLTIQLCIRAAWNGDTVLVPSGAHAENLDMLGRGVLVKSIDGPANTILSAADQSKPVVSFRNAEPAHAGIEGFTITGSKTYAISARGSSPFIHGNWIQNNTAAILGDRTRGLRVIGNIIRFNGPAYPSGYYDGAIILSVADSTIIRSNLAHHNNGYGIISSESGYGTVINNTLIVQRGHAIRTRNGSFRFYNNIVTGSPEWAIDQSWSSTIVADFNCTFENVTDYLHAVPGEGSVYADPQFVDPANADFRLAANSPCLDAGHPDPQYNDPDGSRNDIGAFPFVPGVSALAPDDFNRDGVVDVRDAVILIDQSVRPAEAASVDPQGTGRIRALIERLWRHPRQIQK